MGRDIIVVKFGSSVLRSQADLPTAVHEIYRWYRAGWRVVAVVSAIGDTTDALLAEAHAIAREPAPGATAQLLATGERHSAALLGIALDRAGVPSRVIDPAEIHLTVEGSGLDSELVAVDRERAMSLFEVSPVLVLPGFFGYNASGSLQLLGRGGSDLSAVYLAHALHATRCRLIKDVDGVYEVDPATVGGCAARRFLSLGYADALACAAALIQPKAIRYLERHRASAEVAGIASAYESVVGPFSCALTQSSKPAPTLVLVLGLGTVGLGVYQRLAAMPERFRVIKVLVRNRGRHPPDQIPPHLLTESVDGLAQVRADAVVDALPGPEPSQILTRQFLLGGVSVVSSNKTLIAEAGPELAALAARHGATLLYSAAVGGSAPMLETLRREALAGEVRSISGILNGTCNYVLDRCAEGLLPNEAMRAAQACGFAESNPAEDLSGRDAARKLRVLSRFAFGEELSGLAVEPLDTAAILRLRAALKNDETLRVIARAWKLGSRVFGQIQLEAVHLGDVFAQTRGEWNRLIVTRANGKDIDVSGRGAGRWPTTEAVIADLLQLRFSLHASTQPSSRCLVKEGSDPPC